MSLDGVEIVRHPTARRIRLAVDPASGRTRLVVPKRASLKVALGWAAEKAEWIAEQRARLPRPIPFVDGAVIPFGDGTLTIGWSAGSRRALIREGDRLLAEGPADTVPRRVEAWLRRQAIDVLATETATFAAKAGVSVTRVSIGDPRGRWGSCASSGAIRYSWRLILAPSWVLRATVAHEVAHRLHMDHSPAFHAAVARLLEEDPTPARAWLRANGTRLHWVGRSS